MNHKFEPKTPEYETRIRESFARQRAMATLGIEIASIVPGQVILEMPFNDAFTQQYGFLHAGTVATGLDNACGYAAYSLMPQDAGVLTAEYKINFLAPARGDRFRFTAEVIKPGRTLTLCHGMCHALSAGKETLVSAMAATVMAVYGRSDVDH